MNNINLFCECTHMHAVTRVCEFLFWADSSLLLAHCCLERKGPQKVEQHNSFDVVTSAGWFKRLSPPAMWTETEMYTRPSDNTD